MRLCFTFKKQLKKNGVEYDLSFISLPEGYDETALESALEKNITRFLLELGTGFAKSDNRIVDLQR